MSSPARRLDEASGNQLTVAARNTGSGWQQVAAPNPGNGGRILGGDIGCGRHRLDRWCL